MYKDVADLCSSVMSECNRLAKYNPGAIVRDIIVTMAATLSTDMHSHGGDSSQLQNTNIATMATAVNTAVQTSAVRDIVATFVLVPQNSAAYLPIYTMGLTHLHRGHRGLWLVTAEMGSNGADST